MSLREKLTKGWRPLLSKTESHALLQRFMKEHELTVGEMVNMLRIDLRLELSSATLYRWLNPSWRVERGGGIQLLARVVAGLEADYDGTQEGSTDGD